MSSPGGGATDDLKHRAVLTWLATIFDEAGDADGAPTELAALCDGAALGVALARICPDHVDRAALPSAANDADGNWALAASNLQRLVRALEGAYRGALARDARAVLSRDVDAPRIARERAPAELLRLVELVIGLAVQAPGKEARIGAIMKVRRGGVSRNRVRRRTGEQP